MRRHRPGSPDILATAFVGYADGRTVSGRRSRTIAAGEPLFRAAQRSGEVRDDVSLGQILDGLVALAGIDNDPDVPGALIRILLDGLRTHPHPTGGSPTAGPVSP
uniref:SbtR family transcriptional regulator n=1 Tax=Nonomuraea bangladeshensis TaxID=404385 RepID=UPI003F499648